MSYSRQIFDVPYEQQPYISRMRVSIASEDKRTVGNSGNEPKTTEPMEGEEKKMRVTHRNARAGCCAWSRRPLHSYQRHSGSGKRIPERNRRWRDRHNCVRGYQPQLVRCYRSVASSLRMICACAETASCQDSVASSNV